MQRKVSKRKFSTELTDEIMEYAEGTDEDNLNAAVEWLENNYPVVAWWNGTDWERRYTLNVIVKHTADNDHARRSLRAAESMILESEFAD
jgi:hypothetical protein